MNAIAPIAAALAQDGQDQDPAPSPRLHRRPLLIKRGGFELESYGRILAGFLRIGRLEISAAWERRGWYWLREPGSVEAAAGRYYAVVSWAPCRVPGVAV